MIPFQENKNAFYKRIITLQKNTKCVMLSYMKLSTHVNGKSFMLHCITYRTYQSKYGVQTWSKWEGIFNTMNTWAGKMKKVDCYKFQIVLQLYTIIDSAVVSQVQIHKKVSVLLIQYFITFILIQELSCWSARKWPGLAAKEKT